MAGANVGGGCESIPSLKEGADQLIIWLEEAAAVVAHC